MPPKKGAKRRRVTFELLESTPAQAPQAVAQARQHAGYASLTTKSGKAGRVMGCLQEEKAFSVRPWRGKGAARALWQGAWFYTWVPGARPAAF